MSKKEERAQEGKLQIVSREGDIIRFPGTRSSICIGAPLKEARLHKRISLEEIATIMGVSRYTIINWESNKTKPDYDQLFKLCTVLNVSMTDLFRVKPDFSSFERKIINNLRMLKPATQRLVASMIKNMVDEELLAHDEMLVNTSRILDEVHGAVAAGTAFSGIEIPEEQPTPFFIRISDKTAKADAVVRVHGQSMEPTYHENDVVFFEYTNTASVGDDVVVCWGGNAFIKRLASDGTLFSLNKKYPFVYEGDGSDIHILGRVLGILNCDDIPSESDLPALRELFHDELIAYNREHGGEY